MNDALRQWQEMAFMYLWFLFLLDKLKPLHNNTKCCQLSQIWKHASRSIKTSKTS